MSYGTDTVAGGTTGSLPDVAVATDQISGAKYQRVKLADPNADQTGAYGIDSAPLRVRQRRRGTADYDSGNVAVTASLVAVTSATVYLMGGYAVNLTDQVQWVTLTDTAGDEIMSQFPLQPRESKPIPVNDEVQFVGLKVQASAASSLKVRVWGVQ